MCVCFSGDKLKRHHQGCPLVSAATVMSPPSPRQPQASPVEEAAEVEEPPPSPKRPSLLRVPSFNNGCRWDNEVSLG